MNILTFIGQNEKGVTEDDLIAEFPNLTKKEIAENLNSLLKNKKIDIYNNGTSLIYKEASLYNSDEEKIIYNLIKESGNKGLWLKDIKNKTNIPQNLVSKLLKGMETKKSIKSIKSIKSNKKVYICFNETPSEELTGGVWYNEADIDEEFVENLMKVVYMYISKRTLIKSNESCLLKYANHPSINDIHGFIQESKVSSVSLSIEDLKLLMKVMVYDGKVDELNIEDKVLYRALQIRK